MCKTIKRQKKKTADKREKKDENKKSRGDKKEYEEKEELSETDIHPIPKCLYVGSVVSAK